MIMLQLLELHTNRHTGGYHAYTGHPVMMVVVVEMKEINAQAVIIVRSDGTDWSMCLPAFIFKSHRNNEIIEWFAKYFL